MMRMLKKIAGWSWKKKIIVIICVVLTLVLGAAGAVFGYAASKVNKIQKIEVKKETLKESITEEVEHKSGYLNVAVFGLDSRDGSLDKGNRSDTIMIVSLNQETYEVKMVSVYRDTFMRLKDGSYNKANAAYSYFGPDGGVALLNENMDMNIEKYVSVNFNALVDVIDAVGGMDLELTDAEVVHMNNYCVETSEVTGKSYKKIEPEVGGSYHLNGVQAVSYARIRYTDGGDAQRTVRQRIVLLNIMQKLQQMDLTTINKVADSVFPQIAKSLFQLFRLLDAPPFLISLFSFCNTPVLPYCSNCTFYSSKDCLFFSPSIYKQRIFISNLADCILRLNDPLSHKMIFIGFLCRTFRLLFLSTSCQTNCCYKQYTA